ncbi:DUF6262 family protein [Streptomyces europaeiscabiei]|uniref:DUF6262 family protein n=1 Tax=Streptomyces europaeiscabiei TaxID=146819 RepID=UPI0029A41B87|nr:DUF6262 family protein [Streptomyces europaeiscabiei]MDX3716315.1 DUF6262 family protein [Streptomyces europaeiscabiei]
MTSVPGQTAAAVAARKRQTRQKLTDVDVAIGQLRQERGRLTVRAIAARAAVSATFLYENPEARARVQAAIADSKSRHDRTTSAEHDGIEATWRERALNAEAELTRAQKKIYVQRHRIGELMCQVSDFSQTAPGESVEALVTENTNGSRSGSREPARTCASPTNVRPILRCRCWSCSRETPVATARRPGRARPHTPDMCPTCIKCEVCALPMRTLALFMV